MQLNNPDLNQNISIDYSWGNWALFYLATFLFMANLFAAVAIYPAYSLDIGSSAFQAGLQSTIFALASVLFRFFLGPRLDRQGPKPLMLVGIFTFATSPLLLIMSPTYTMLISMRLYQALGLAVVLPGISTLAAGMAPTGRIGAYLGTTRIFFNLGLLAGPSAALTLIEGVSYNSWFIVSATSSAIALAAMAAVKTPPVPSVAEIATGSLNQIKKVFKVKQIYPVIGGIAVYSFTYSAVISFAAVHIESSSHRGDGPLFFVILGVAGIASCLGAGVLSDRFGRRQVGWPMLAVLGTGAALFYFLPSWPALVIICAIILGIGIQGTSLVLTAWLIDLSKPSHRATTISVQENTIDIFFALGALSFGMAAEGPGLGTAFLAAGIMTVVLIIPLNKASLALARQSP
ncbi:MAG: MFS transporter [Firmicutes bacterium]|nr:MFS transporter [Bacillota bacterium]